MNQKNHKQKHKEFMKIYFQDLIKLDVPLKTLEFDAWLYLLEHGNCVYTSWFPKNLSKNQIQKLLNIIEKYPGAYDKVFMKSLKNQL